MSEQEAFEQWRTNKYLAKEFGALTLQDAWQAALEWARSEQEPVAWLCTETKVLYSTDTAEVDKYHGFKPTVPLYTHPAPAVAVNEQLLEALEIIAGRKQCIDNLMSNADIAEAALQAAKKGGV